MKATMKATKRKLPNGCREAFSLLAVVMAAGCASTQVSQTTGNHLRDTVSAGRLQRTDYVLQMEAADSGKRQVAFRAQAVEQRQKQVTPQYEEVRVTHVREYAPNPAELVIDAVLLPLVIVFNVSDYNFAGYRTRSSRELTGRAVAGPARMDGVIGMPPQPLGGEQLEIKINDVPFGTLMTDGGGRFVLPARDIVDAYLIDERCVVHATGLNRTFNAQCNLPRPVLDRLLNQVHALGWPNE